MSDTTRRGLFGMLASIPIAMRFTRFDGSTPEVPAKGYARAGAEETWENTQLRVALFHGDVEVSGRGYRRVLAMSKGGKVQPLGTTSLRAEFPRAESDWGLIDSYKIIDGETGQLVAVGRFNNWDRPPYVAIRDNVTFDLEMDITFGLDDEPSMGSNTKGSDT